MLIIFIILIVFLAIVGFGILFGAPFIPTRKIWIKEALDLAKINSGDVVVDLGSGDGAVLIESLKRGAKRAIGYEVNPLLATWSRLRIRLSGFDRREIQVKTADFFRVKLPADITVIYLFQVNRAMKKVPNFIRENRAQIQAKQLRVVCFGFTLPGEKVAQTNNGMRLYYF